MNAQTSLLAADQPATDELTTSILQNAAVLRVLLTRETFSTFKELAELVGRDDSNLGKSLRTLEEDGAIVQETVVKDEIICGRVVRLTEFGRRALQGFDFAEGRFALPAGYVIRTHAQLQAHPLNPRKDWTSDEAVEALDQLRQSIIARGIRLPIEIRLNPADGPDYIVSGERRWRALGDAIHDDDLPADFPIVCSVKEVESDAAHMVLALEENQQHFALNHLEAARGYAYLRDVEKWGTDRIADEGKVTRKTVQNKLRLLEPKNAELARQVEAGELTYHQALKAMIEPKATAGDGLFGADLPQHKRGDEQKPLELTAKQALIVIELADRCEKQAHPLFEGYTQIAVMPTSGDGMRLMEKGIITCRSGMEMAFGKVMLHSAGAKRWLTDNGFYEDRGELLHKARTAIVGEAKAAEAEAEGRYVTDWLNLEPGADAAAAVRTLAVQTPAAPPEPELDDNQLCALVEIVVKAKLDDASAPGFTNPAAYVASAPMTDPLLKSLCWGGYLQGHYLQPGYRPGATYTEKAVDLLDRLDLNPLYRPGALRDAQLKSGRDAFALDILEANGRWVTALLNVPAVEPQPEPEPAGDLAATGPMPAPDAPVAQTAPASSIRGADSEDGEEDAEEGRFAPAAGEPARPVHVVPPSSLNLQAGADYARVTADRLARDLANSDTHWSGLTAEAIADVVLGAMEDGDFGAAAAHMAALLQRAGHFGAGPQLMRALARHVDHAMQEA
jgi:ParB/RepB/Spo0J family partition protein